MQQEMLGEYSSKAIQVLEGLEAVRVRPGMYIGSTDQRRLHHLIYEILDNAVDEEDRLKRALLMYHAGSVVERLSAGDVPDKDVLKPALEEYLPE